MDDLAENGRVRLRDMASLIGESFQLNGLVSGRPCTSVQSGWHKSKLMWRPTV